MIKRPFISLATPTFISAFMALGTIWLYLSRMGRLDVFLESINFKDLFVVVAMFLVGSVSMICLIFLHSFTVGFSCYKKREYGFL